MVKRLSTTKKIMKEEELSMNRAERRKLVKEQRRPNSKKNFVNVGYQEIPVDQIQHDPNLKECDKEIVDLIIKRFEWADKGLVTNTLSKCIIMKGCDYLDTLCSLRFDITPPDDKALVRDTMYYVGNFANLFIGMMADEEYGDKNLFENNQEHIENGDKQFYSPCVQALYPQCGLPSEEVIDDMYASFISGHAQKLTSFLQHTRKSDIEGDEEYVLEVLQMILKKTNELLPEAQVNSRRFVVQM